METREFNEYDQQAADFLHSCNASLSFRFVGCEINKEWKDSIARNHYKFIIKTPKGQYTGDFWDSANNTYEDIAPRPYDVLSCLEKYSFSDFEDFCFEFGYDTDSRSAERIYKACCKQYKALCRIFTDDQMEALRDIQ